MVTIGDNWGIRIIREVVGGNNQRIAYYHGFQLEAPCDGGW